MGTSFCQPAAGLDAGLPISWHRAHRFLQDIEEHFLRLVPEIAQDGEATMRQLLDRIPGVLRALRQAHKDLLLRHFEGLSNQEVAILLGLDPATASKRHGRAMLRLHKLLFEGGFTESQL